MIMPALFAWKDDNSGWNGFWRTDGGRYRRGGKHPYRQVPYCRYTRTEGCGNWGFSALATNCSSFLPSSASRLLRRPRMSSKYEVLSSSSQFGQARGIDGAAPLKTGAFGTISDCGSFSSSPFCLNSSSSSDRSWGCSIWIPPICRRSSDQIFLWEAKIKTESCLGEIHGNE